MDSVAVDLVKGDLEREASEGYKCFVVRNRLKRVSNEAVKYNAFMRKEGSLVGTSSTLTPRMGVC